MIAAEIIRQVIAAGGQITADNADLVLTAPRPLPPDLLDQIKVHKPALLAALAAPAVTEEAVDADRQDSLKAHKALRRRSAPKVPRGLGYTASGTPQAPLQDTLMARQIRAMNEGRPLPLVDLSSAFYEIVGFFEERLAAGPAAPAGRDAHEQPPADDRGRP